MHHTHTRAADRPSKILIEGIAYIMSAGDECIASLYRRYPQKQPGIVLEKVDEERLDWLLEHRSIVEGVDKRWKRGMKDRFGSEPTKFQKELLDSSLYDVLRMYKTLPLEDGYRRVRYVYAHKQHGGRLYSSDPSVQRLPRVIRHFLTHGLVRDFDVVCAHATFIQYLCRASDIPRPVMDAFIAERRKWVEEAMADMNVDWDYAKRVFTKVMYGGNACIDVTGDDGSTTVVRCNTRFMADFHRECKGLADALSIQPAGPFHPIYLKLRQIKRITLPGPSSISRAGGAIENAILRIVTGMYPSRADMFDGFHTDAEGDAADMCARMSAEISTAFPDLNVVFVEKAIPEVTKAALAVLAGMEAAAAHAPPEVHEIDYETDEEGDASELPQYGPVERPQYLPATFIRDLTSQLISVCAGMGEGKTTNLETLIAHFAGMGRTIVIVTQRRSMVDVMYRAVLKAGFIAYRYSDLTLFNKGSPIDVGVDATPILIVEYESIHRVRVRGGVDVFILDEFSAIIRAIDSTTNGDRRISNFERFKEIASHGGTKIVATCADMLTDCGAYMFQDYIAGWRAEARRLHLDDEARYEYAVTGIRPSMETHQAIFDAGVPPEWHRHESQLRLMRRTVVSADVPHAIWRIRADLHKGRRVVVMCGSEGMARLLNSMLGRDVTTGTVGLYTSKTYVNGALQDIDEVWKHHQLIIYTSVITTGASFELPVHRVYVFPCTKASTASDIMQGTGRSRNILTDEIWFGTDAHQFKKVTRADLDARFKEQVDRIQHGVWYSSVTAMEVASESRHTTVDITPPSKVIAPDSPLIATQALCQMHKFYTDSMGQFMGLIKYLTECKGYTWRTARIQIRPTEEDLQLIEYSVKVGKEDMKRARETLLDSLDVSALANTLSDMAILRKMAGGAKDTLANEATFCEKYSSKFDTCDRDTLQMVLSKAETTQMFPGVAATPDFIKRVKDHRSKLLLINMSGDAANRHVYIADYLQHIAKHEAFEISDPQPVMVLSAINRVAIAMGLEHALDTDTYVRDADIDPDALRVVLKDLDGIGLHGPVGKADFVRAADIMLKRLGVKVVAGKRCVVAGHVADLIKLRPQFTDAAKLYESRHGEPPPAKNKYRPSRSMTAMELQQFIGRFEGEQQWSGDIEKARMYIDFPNVTLEECFERSAGGGGSSKRQRT